MFGSAARDAHREEARPEPSSLDPAPGLDHNVDDDIDDDVDFANRVDDDDEDDDDQDEDEDDEPVDANDIDAGDANNWVTETDEIDESASARPSPSTSRDNRQNRDNRPRPNDRGGLRTDSGRADSGRADSGRVDLGRADLGRADSGRVDLGRADSGRVDSGRNDSGRNEAGRNDSGRNDAGRNDSGRADRSGGRNNRAANDRGPNRGSVAGHPVGPDGEPLADWELAVLTDGGQAGAGNDRNPNRVADRERADNGEDADPNNRRSRRRGRGRGRDREDVVFETLSADPIPVTGVLDLRDEGYGFLRVDGCLPSKDDVYVSVKQVRQYGLRKGDLLSGLSRPANRNEKNPGFHQIDTVNDLPVDEGRNRVRFDDLTPLFPDERLVLEMKDEPLNMTTRIIDLVAPIGKGQRALIVSPPKAGKTTIMKDIARAIETNNPDVRLIVLLLDERPEEVTDMRRQLTNGEVIASTFDRPPEEHCAVAELTIERAKRLVEAGEDVCVILDGITRLSRAYNLSAPQTGRAMSGGLDAGALYPPKRFFGAARNLEEGGSLTILATALVETGSRMDEVIFEEFKGTGNCEIRLDRRLAEKRVFPALDIDGSSTRHEELLFERAQLQQVWKLRRVLSGMSEDGSSAAAVEMLIDRLKTFKTNADFLNEIAKAPSV